LPVKHPQFGRVIKRGDNDSPERAGVWKMTSIKENFAAWHAETIKDISAYC
jgi:hypothetical protein